MRININCMHYNEGSCNIRKGWLFKKTCELIVSGKLDGCEDIKKYPKPEITQPCPPKRK